MGTIAQKLSYIEDTKTAIGNAIAAKGGSVTGKTFRQYATEIENLPSGGGGNQELIDLIECDITSLNIPSGTTKIGNFAFNYRRTLASVTIPNTVTRIDDDAFFGCSGLTSITIPDSVTYIGNESFYMCDVLTTVNIGTGVTYIGSIAFNECLSLTSFTINKTTPPTLESDTFNNFNGTIYVPAASVDAYKAATNWSTYADRIQAIPSE